DAGSRPKDPGLGHYTAPTRRPVPTRSGRAYPATPPRRRVALPHPCRACGAVSGPIYFEEPPIARRVFASTTFAWLWLALRLYLGWEWLVSGWGKTFGGAITWKVWNWGDDAYSLTGTANCGWIRSCTGADG